VETCQLHDLGYEGNQFTWFKGKRDAVTAAERLDRMMATVSWILEFEGAVVTHLPRLSSDHCLLLLDIPPTSAVTKRKKVYRFEALWVKDDQCKGVIEQAWGSEVQDGSPMFRVFEKLKHCRVSLIAWSSLKFGNFAAQIKRKREQLQRLVIDNPPGHSKNIMELQDDINLLLEKEEVFWRQRSRVSWLREGDKNTKFFHAQCNQRRKTNLIRGL
jgi:hypothetical protein